MRPAPAPPSLSQCFLNPSETAHSVKLLLSWVDNFRCERGTTAMHRFACFPVWSQTSARVGINSRQHC